LGDKSCDAIREYYREPGIMTAVGSRADLLAGLPSDLESLVRVVQGVMLHVYWAQNYGLALTDERKQEVNIRPVAKKLMRIAELDDRPLAQERPLDRRLVSNCRDYAVLLCALLKCQGVAARARCGFGAYFEPDHYEDHWVCEYWNADQGRWVLVDGQLDALQRKVLQITFDPLDVPRDQFVTGAAAWQMCRAGKADPDRFGIFDMHGLWFVRGDLIRDFLALNNLEILPWDSWGLIVKDESEITHHDLAYLDHLAATIMGADETFSELRALYERGATLRPPEGWEP
jgi:hypothetical protein